jgi:elongation factor P
VRVAVLHAGDERPRREQREARRRGGRKCGIEAENAAQFGGIADGPGQFALPRGRVRAAPAAGGRGERHGVGRGVHGMRLTGRGGWATLVGLRPQNAQGYGGGPRKKNNRSQGCPVPAYNTSEFKKGLKVQIDGDPYIMIECNFVKPGKGQALYKCKLRNLLRNTVLDRTYKSGDSLDAADIATIEAQYLYKQGEAFVFMDNANYEQYELSKEQVDDAWKWIKEGTVCSMLLYNGNPISMEPPNHMVLKVEYAEPAMRGNTATNLTKPVKLETGADVIVPAFIEQGDLIKVDTRTGEYLERVKV